MSIIWVAFAVLGLVVFIFWQLSHRKAAPSGATARRKGRWEESLPKVFKDNLNKDCQSDEGRVYHLVARWPWVAKGYVSEETEVHIRMGLLNAGYQCAILYWPIVNERACVKRDRVRPQSTRRGGKGDIEVPVLVEIAEVFQPGSPPSLIGIGLKARLVGLDECYCWATHPLGLVLPPTLPLTGSITKREGRSLGRLVVVGEHELPSEVVKRGTKVIDGVPCGDANAERGSTPHAFDDPALVSALRIKLDPLGIWLGLNKGSDESISFISVVATTRELAEGAFELLPA